MIDKALFNRNLQMIPRRFHGMHVCDVGYIPEKKERLNHVFDTLNYSIVLSGSGTYSSEGNHFALEAPCIMTQFPGIRSHYGPHPGTTWEEFYIMLPAEQLSWVQSRGLFGDNPFMWPIRNLPAVLRAIRTLLPLLETSDQRPGKADRIDHLAERIIMESLLPGEEQSDPGYEAVNGLAQSMAAAPEKSYNYREVARDFGVSYSTFQRRWRDLFDIPPGQYLLNLRISECCRLMTETDLKLVDIAQQLGF